MSVIILLVIKSRILRSTFGYDPFSASTFMQLIPGLPYSFTSIILIIWPCLRKVPLYLLHLFWHLSTISLSIHIKKQLFQQCYNRNREDKAMASSFQFYYTSNTEDIIFNVPLINKCIICISHQTFLNLVCSYTFFVQTNEAKVRQHKLNNCSGR